MEQAVLYLRCSTAEQSSSTGNGHSHETQLHHLELFCAGKYEIVGVYREVASGATPLDLRPMLGMALAEAQRQGATLLVQKVDRLSRDTELVCRMLNRGVRFQIAECPDAGHFEIQLRSIFAEEERRKIRKRTKHGITAAKARGVKFGSPHLDRDRPKAWQANRDNANAFAQQLAPVIAELRKVGITSATAMANALNTRGIKTRRNKQWHAATVCNLLKRLPAS